MSTNLFWGVSTNLYGHPTYNDEKFTVKRRISRFFEFLNFFEFLEININDARCMDGLRFLIIGKKERAFSRKCQNFEN